MSVNGLLGAERHADGVGTCVDGDGCADAAAGGVAAGGVGVNVNTATALTQSTTRAALELDGTLKLDGALNVTAVDKSRVLAVALSVAAGMAGAGINSVVAINKTLVEALASGGSISGGQNATVTLDARFNEGIENEKGTVLNENGTGTREEGTADNATALVVSGAAGGVAVNVNVAWAENTANTRAGLWNMGAANL